MFSKNAVFQSATLACAAALLISCGGGESAAENGGLTGSIRIDGSSTVFPITRTVAEEFKAEHPDVNVSVSISGTGGGFKKFVVGETDINNASRPVKESEIALMEENGVEFIELPVAFDGVTVIVNPDNDWVDSMTVEELRQVWGPESTVTMWSDVRPDWPEEEIGLYGPGPDSGTFDYFTEAVMGEGGASRPDFTATEDDNLIVQGVSGDEYGLGFLGFAYFQENEERLKAVPIREGDEEPVSPTMETIRKGTYTPLSRPIFIYVNAEAASQPALGEFVRFYLENATELVPLEGYVPLPDIAYQMAEERFAGRETGTVFDEGVTVGISIEDVLQREREG